MEWILLGLVLLVVIIWYVIYAGIIRSRNGALEALGSIDVQLRKRHDLIPNILKMVQKYMDHEKELLGRITALRARVTSDYDRKNPEQVQDHLQAEGELQVAMGSLFNAVSENYPELRSSENMKRAQETFEEVEGHIAAARRYYNSSVTQLKNSVQIWPGSAIARQIGIQEMPYFEETDEAVRAPIDANQHLK